VPGCQITQEKEEANRLDHGDIVFARTGGTTGKSFLIKSPPRAVFASYLIRLKPSVSVLSEYLYMFFQSDDYWAQVRKNARGGAQPNVNATLLGQLVFPLPPLDEQKRILKILNKQMAAVERARSATELQLEAARSIPFAYICQSYGAGKPKKIPLERCVEEVKNGVGSDWKKYRLIGATRGGIAPAKESVGKKPERYKLVDAGTIFYNPMRILIGSIATVDEGDEPGITSPDYVVLKTKHGILHPRWFYYWMRSSMGEQFIKAHARGAVRERLTFRRLASGELEVPDWTAQLSAAKKMKNISSLVGKITEQMETINALPAALLCRAFEGKL